jgi:histidinol-phosphate aminotransferase
MLTRQLADFGWRVVPTWANFLYCDLGEDASGLAGQLQSAGVSVRPLRAWGAPNCLRVSIGTPEQNQVFLGKVRQIVVQRSNKRITIP